MAELWKCTKRVNSAGSTPSLFIPGTDLRLAKGTVEGDVRRAGGVAPEGWVFDEPVWKLSAGNARYVIERDGAAERRHKR